MKNLPLIIGLLSTVILSLYCVDFHTEPILQKLSQKSVHKNSSKAIKQHIYTETMAKPITSKVVSQVKSEVPEKIQPPLKEQEIEKPKVISKDDKESKKEELKVKQESELDILAKRILENMKKNKDKRWRQ